MRHVRDNNSHDSIDSSDSIIDSVICMLVILHIYQLRNVVFIIAFSILRVVKIYHNWFR